MERHELDKLFKMIVFFTGFQISSEYTHDTIYALQEKIYTTIHRNDRKKISEICKLFYNYLFNLLTDKLIQVKTFILHNDSI